MNVFTGSETIRAVESCPFGVCNKNYTIVISNMHSGYFSENGEPLYRAEGRIGGIPFTQEMVPESVRNDPYRNDNLDWLKVKMFKNAKIDSRDVQVGCATPSC
jgi:hypothetical protein